MGEETICVECWHYVGLGMGSEGYVYDVCGHLSERRKNFVDGAWVYFTPAFCGTQNTTGECKHFEPKNKEKK